MITENEQFKARVRTAVKEGEARADAEEIAEEAEGQTDTKKSANPAREIQERNCAKRRIIAALIKKGEGETH